VSRTDPGSGAFFYPLDPKSPDPGSGMIIPDLVFEILVSVFRVKKILEIFYADPDPGFCVNPESRIRDKHPGSARMIEINLNEDAAAFYVSSYAL